MSLATEYSDTASRGAAVRLRLSDRVVRLRTRVENSHLLSSLLAVADHAMISGTKFVTAVLIGRCCGAETLGIYSLVAAALAMVIGVQEQIITAPYVLYHNRRRGRTLRRYTGSILIHQTLFITIACLILAACLAGISQATYLVRLVTWILLISAPAILLRTFVREIALAHRDVLTVVIVDAAVCAAQLGAVLLLLGIGAVNLPTIYCALGASCVLTAAWWLHRNRRQFLLERRVVVIHWWRNWRFGRWALATHIAGTSTPYLMPWVLFLMHGESETGYLASCSVIVGIANILLSGMADFLSPRAAAAYAHGGVQDLKPILRSMLVMGILAISSVCIIAALFGEQLINTIYDGRFPGAGSIATLLSLSVLANAVGNVAGNGLWAIDRPRANFTADILTFVVAVAAALTMIGPCGAKGAAMATLSACIFGAAARQLIFRRACREVTDPSSPRPPAA